MGIPLIGSTLDKYQILQKVGEGGMATVYRGRHTTLDRDVAIKVLHPHLSRSPRNRSRFAREARAIEHLEHDNILRIFDYSGQDADDCYIVTEFVDGATLQALVQEQGRLPGEVVALIALRLTAALGYAHDLGIIHRDLKPENVMLRRDGEVKLMDFGIARFLDEMHLTVTGALVGSPAYMSPEQAMERVLDQRSDLFSLGTLLFHLLTGVLPFSGNNPSIILRNIIEGKRPEVLELAPDVPGSLADLVESLLQTDPDDRPSGCAAVYDRLEAVLTEVRIDPGESTWALETWLVHPRDYEERLQAHLRVVLLEEGRSRLAEQDHLGALRQLNRLLSIDEDNPAVLELVESMHAGMLTDQERDARPWVLGSVGVALAAALLAVFLWPAPDERSQGTSEAVSLQPGGGLDPVRASTPAAPRIAEPQESPLTPSDEPAAPEATIPGPRERPRVTADGGSPGSTPAAKRVVSAPQEPGKLRVVIPGSWAFMWLDGKNVGRTGKVPVVEVMPGKHQLVLKNKFAKEVVVDFEIASGEERRIEVEQVPLPAIGRFPAEMDSECRVTVDGQDQGRVGALAYRIEIEQPGSPHRLGVACPAAPARMVQLLPMRPAQVFAVDAEPAERTRAAEGSAVAVDGAP